MLILRSVTKMYMCDSEVSIHGIERKKDILMPASSFINYAHKTHKTLRLAIHQKKVMKGCFLISLNVWYFFSCAI